MRLQTKPLRKALSEIGRVIKTRTTLPTLQFIRLSCTGDNRLLIEATNCDAWMSRLIERVDGFDPLLINYDRLVDFASCASAETLELLPVDGGKRIVLTEVGTKRRRVISILPPEQFAAEIPTSDSDVGIGVSLADLADGLDAVAWAASSNPKLETWKLTTLVDMKPNALTCVATSGTFMAIHRRALICEDRQLVLPASLVPVLAEDLRGEGASLLQRGNLLAVRHQDGAAAIKLSEAPAMPYERLLGQRRRELDGCLVDREALRRCCKEAKDLAGYTTYPAINAEKQGDTVKLWCDGPNGEYTDEVDSFGGGDLKLKVPAVDLDNALSRSAADEVRVVSLPNVVFIETGDCTYALSQCVDTTKEEKPKEKP